MDNWLLDARSEGEAGLGGWEGAGKGHLRTPGAGAASCVLTVTTSESRLWHFTMVLWNGTTKENWVQDIQAFRISLYNFLQPRRNLQLSQNQSFIFKTVSHWNDTALKKKNTLTVSYKLKHRLTIRHTNFTSGKLPKRNENKHLPLNLHANICSNFHVVFKNWEQLECHQQWSIHTMEQKEAINMGNTTKQSQT